VPLTPGVSRQCICTGGSLPGLSSHSCLETPFPVKLWLGLVVSDDSSVPGIYPIPGLGMCGLGCFENSVKA
jgi:hypothetical protein